MYIPYPIQLLCLYIPQSDNLLTNSYADDFAVSCSNSNVAQMAEALTTHSTNIDQWADERGLAISAPKSTITLFTTQFAQVTLNNSLLPLERTPSRLEVTFNPHFKFSAHIKYII